MSQWLFFQIEGQPLPPEFTEMGTITPLQCVHAIAHTAIHGGTIELYLDDGTPDNPPMVGLVFQGGVYLYHGLGCDETIELQRDFDQNAGEPLIEFNEHEQPVNYEWLLDLFQKGLAIANAAPV